MENKIKLNRFEIERRSLDERRKEGLFSKFPIRLESGSVVSKDRRFIPERRLQKIVVSEKDLQADEFNELFKKFS